MKSEPAAPAGQMEDVQGRVDTRRITINAAGVRDLRHPIAFFDRDGEVHNTVANVSMSVSVPHHVKGAHMSRFVEALTEQSGALSVSTMAALASSMTSRLESRRGEICLSFPWFVSKRAPVSGVVSIMDYQTTIAVKQDDHDADVQLTVAIPATSLCPCSKQISDYGAHNQRSMITLTVGLDPTCDQPLWIEDLIDIAEREASSQVYGVLKRPDEKHVTEHAYDNPKFVEDMVRDLAAPLDADPRVARYVIDVENFESIHNHSAFATVECDKTV